MPGASASFLANLKAVATGIWSRGDRQSKTEMALAGVEGDDLEKVKDRAAREDSAGRERAGAGWGDRDGDAGALPRTAAEGSGVSPRGRVGAA